MSKVVYLMGISGSGKSTLANHFRATASVLHVDTIQMSAGARLCPFSKVSVWHQSEFWEPLFKLANVQIAVMLAVEEQLRQTGQSLSNDRGVVLEGNFLRVPRWRETFASVLSRLNLEVDQETAMWLDPSVNVILNHRGKRNQTHDLGVDETKVQNDKAWFAGEIEKYGGVTRYESRDEAQSVIETFLSANAAN